LAAKDKRKFVVLIKGTLSCCRITFESHHQRRCRPDSRLPSRALGAHSGNRRHLRGEVQAGALGHAVGQGGGGSAYFEGELAALSRFGLPCVSAAPGLPTLKLDVS